MKRVMCILPAVVMLLLLIACGGTGAATGSGATAGSAANAEEYFVWDGTTITELTDAGKAQAALVIPVQTTAIKKQAFDKNDTLEKLSFAGSGDINIDMFTFKECTALKTVTLPEGMTVLSDYTFADCPALCDVALPSTLKVIGTGAFRGCHELTAIDLKNVTEIQYRGFSTSGLESITFPATTETIGVEAFSYCEQLATADFLGVVTIEEQAFMMCTALRELVLPETLTTLGPRAFIQCFALERARMPASITSIGDGIFATCDKLVACEVKEGSEADLNFDQFYIVDRENTKKVLY